LPCSHRYKKQDITVRAQAEYRMGAAQMARHATTVNAVEQNLPAAQYRCLCCDGVIANLSEETIPVGLDLKLGLVADECALICNACTARLIEARHSKTPSADRRG
jgi:uncharacterized protein with PIN domain